MKKRILGAAAIAALLLAACNGARTNDNHAQNEDHGHADGIRFTREQAALAGLETDTVTPAPFRSVLRASGEIGPAQADQTTIVATANGVVTFAGSIPVGTRVAAGATLLTISARNLADGDPAARAEIAYRTALREYERAKGLVADQIISAKEFEQVRMRYQNARNAYQAQAADVTPSGVRVTSPVGGYITSLLVGQGDYVTVGQPIATVSRNRRLQLRADVPPSLSGELKSVVGANLITPYDKKVHRLSALNARLLSVGQSTDKSSPYIPLTFEFDHAEGIVPGSFVEVFLLGAPQNDAISVPAGALTEEQGLYFVYVQTGDELFEKREVEPGQSDGVRVRILSGLAPGERVVSQGAYQVKLAGSGSVIPEGHNH